MQVFNRTNGANRKHGAGSALFYCQKVVDKVGPIKAIDKETLSCSEFYGKSERYR
jgi:hypothetical protein